MNEALKAELLDWLLALAWGVDILGRPGLGRLVSGTGEWEDHERLRRQMLHAERQGLLRREGRAGGLVCRLTEPGRLAALGGRDPEARWDRVWDGRWRMVLFDLPARPRRVRQRLLRWLHEHHFGFLQYSVWIHPDSLSELTVALGEYRDDVESLTVMEAECGAGYTNLALVRGAWDLDEINKRYAAYLEGFGRSHALAIASGRGTFAWASRWLRSERVAWEHALGVDPLLPRALWPPGYRGEEAWSARRRLVRAVAVAVARGRPKIVRTK